MLSQILRILIIFGLQGSIHSLAFAQEDNFSLGGESIDGGSNSNSGSLLDNGNGASDLFGDLPTPNPAEEKAVILTFTGNSVITESPGVVYCRYLINNDICCVAGSTLLYRYRAGLNPFALLVLKYVLFGSTITIPLASNFPL